MNAQLALALLALGPVKTSLAAAGPAAGQAPVSPTATAAAAPTKDARDPIAFLAREWLAKR